MKPAATQRDMNMNFDGIGDGPKKGSSRFAHNHWSGHMNDGRLVNKGRGPTTAGQTGHKTPGSTASVPALPAQGSVRDNINRGHQVRGSGSTTVKKPTNPDTIRVGQSGGPGYGQTQKGSRPSTAASQSDFNYGPKKQY
jgi:hypothetical protein